MLSAAIGGARLVAHSAAERDKVRRQFGVCDSVKGGSHARDLSREIMCRLVSEKEKLVEE